MKDIRKDGYPPNKVGMYWVWDQTFNEWVIAKWNTVNFLTYGIHDFEVPMPFPRFYKAIVKPKPLKTQ